MKDDQQVVSLAKVHEELSKVIGSLERMRPDDDVAKVQKQISYDVLVSIQQLIKKLCPEEDEDRTNHFCCVPRKGD